MGSRCLRKVLELGRVPIAIVELSRGHRRGQLRLQFQEVASTIGVNMASLRGVQGPNLIGNALGNIANAKHRPGPKLTTGALSFDWHGQSRSWAANYFNPSTLPLARRRIASFKRLSFVSSRLADSIQARYRRRCEGASASK